MKKVFYIVMPLLLAACGRGSSEAPQISLEEVGPGTITEYQDSIYMRISFYDKDGDLGENFTDDPNLFVLDNRLGIAHEFRISNIVPGGAEVSIQGELEWTINSVYITGSESSEVVDYDIYVVDRVGNQSNILTTPGITVVK